MNHGHYCGRPTQIRRRFFDETWQSLKATLARAKTSRQIDRTWEFSVSIADDSSDESPANRAGGESLGEEDQDEDCRSRKHGVLAASIAQSMRFSILSLALLCRAWSVRRVCFRLRRRLEPRREGTIPVVRIRTILARKIAAAEVSATT